MVEPITGRGPSLLLSRRKFVTITVSDENVQAQIAYPMSKGDVTITSSHSRELTRFGWNGSLNSLPACYLTGLLLGKKSLRKESRRSYPLYWKESIYVSGRRLS